MIIPVSSNEPLVSVLVPVYNHAAYITECLDSILNDDYGPIELIVIDDGSSDSSWEIVQDWVRCHRDRFVHVVAETQSNQGICKTFNRLVSSAKGEYLVFIASDDAFLRGGVRARVAYLQAHPEHLAVFGRVELIGENIKAIKRIARAHKNCRMAWSHPKLLVRELLLRWSLAGPVLMCRRTAYDSHSGVGLYNESLSFEDLDFYMRLLSRDALGFVDQVVARYRVHVTNTSRSEAHRKSAAADAYQIFAGNVKRFKGLNRAIITLKMWMAERGLRHCPAPHHLLARHALSLIRKLHVLQVFFETRWEGRHH